MWETPFHGTFIQCPIAASILLAGVTIVFASDTARSTRELNDPTENDRFTDE